MMYGMPVLIFVFAISAPSGVALYWAVSMLIRVLQTYFLNNPFKIIAEREAVAQAESRKRFRRQERKALVPQKSAKRKIRRNLVMVLFTGSTVEEAIQKGLKRIRYSKNEGPHQGRFEREKGFLGLFGKKPAQVDIEAISETTVIKANQQAIKGSKRSQ